MTRLGQVKAARAMAEAERIEEAFADQRKLHDAIATVTAWHRAGVPALTPLEVVDLLLYGVMGDSTEPGEEGTPPAPAGRDAPHPRESERDPVFGTLPVTAPSGPRQAAGPPITPQEGTAR